MSHEPQTRAMSLSELFAWEREQAAERDRQLAAEDPEPQYWIVYCNGCHGAARPWQRTVAFLAEMREDYGSAKRMREMLRIPDPVERVP